MSILTPIKFATRWLRCVWLFLLSLAPAMAWGNDRPNILFAFADDWGRYASAYAHVDGSGTVNDVIETPNFDRVAEGGVLFRHAFVTAPSCTPCRSSLMSGQYFFRTGLGAILQGASWDSSIPTYPLLLQASGYHIGHTYKVWSPGTPADAPYGAKARAFVRRGNNFNRFSQAATQMVAEGLPIDKAKQSLLDEVRGNFADFLAARDPDKPFCYFFGPTNVHRKWIAGSGADLWGLNPDDLKGKLPKFLPDVPVVRQDFADYLGEAMAFDAGLGVLLDQLEAIGELENTMIVVSGDHGAPGFPRGKCNLYDFGTSVALAIRWDKQIPSGRVVDDLVNLMDLAPTFLQVGNVDVPEVMTGQGLLGLLLSDKQGQVEPHRNWVVTGRERHVGLSRPGRVPYPQRALRTTDYLYVLNFEPDRWPMGDPYQVTESSLPSLDELTNETYVAFADMDASPTKAWLVAHRNDFADQYRLAFDRRPREELYVLADDPDQIVNRASDPSLHQLKTKLFAQLMDELKRTGDPRVTGSGLVFELPPFAGELPK